MWWNLITLVIFYQSTNVKLYGSTEKTFEIWTFHRNLKSNQRNQNTNKSSQRLLSSTSFILRWRFSGEDFFLGSRENDEILNVLQDLNNFTVVKMVKVLFLHPDLGIGGAERLVVDAGLALRTKNHDVHFVTCHHDPDHCFEETRDGSLQVTSVGDWLPR